MYRRDRRSVGTQADIAHGAQVPSEPGRGGVELHGCGGRRSGLRETPVCRRPALLHL